MRKINAITFDMDGLLLDTETIALSTFTDACREFSFQPDLHVYFRCIGTTATRTKEILTKGYGENFPFKAISEVWRKKYYEETNNKPVSLKEGAQSLLLFLEKEAMKKVVVTSTRQKNAQNILAKAHILHYFDEIIGGDDVSNGKPHPEIYFTACQKLGEEPVNCLALEDSDNGVLSALNAGLWVIQIPDLVEPSAKMRANGHKIVKSLVEVENILRNSSVYEKLR
jgi:HAD superfamily hydrolase (TIGR01509 family)